MWKLTVLGVLIMCCACDDEGGDDAVSSGGTTNATTGGQSSGGANQGGAPNTGGAGPSGGATGGERTGGSGPGPEPEAGASAVAGEAGMDAGGAAQTGGASNTGGAQTGGTSSAGAPSEGTIAEQFPGDVGIEDDDAVLFFDDFETGWGRWDSPDADTQYLYLESDAVEAHTGEGYLRSTVTVEDLEENEYISAAPSYAFDRRVDAIYWRFHVRFPVVAPNPHHWIRVEAGNEEYGSSGLANTVPPGDEGFWFDFDIDNDDQFNFYSYWYLMRSGRCNDGSATPGCEGDQGTTYYYGNVFEPAEQTPFERDQWLCVELAAGVNGVGESDGWLAFWVNDVEVGRYAPGEPEGTWLRAEFHEGGCDFSACTPPVPFEGFDFRSAPDVQFKRIILDAYYERGSSADKRAELEARGLTLSDEQTILYDDIVVATTRIGCRREP